MNLVAMFNSNSEKSTSYRHMGRECSSDLNVENSKNSGLWSLCVVNVGQGGEDA